MDERRQHRRSRSRSNGAKQRKASKKAHLDKAFLHRCCVQFSAPFAAKNWAEDAALHKEFIIRFAGERSEEISRAVVWRVMSSSGGYDLLGSWKLLTSMFDYASNEVMIEVNVLKRLELFLEPLILARWYNSVSSRIKEPDGSNGGDPVEEMKRKLGIGSQTSSASSSPAADSQGTGEFSAAFPESVELLQAFRELAATWLRKLSDDVASALRRRMREVQEHGNSMDAKAQYYLEIPDVFVDSIHKLRRRFPRPTNVRDVLLHYGWNFASRQDDFTNPDGLPTVSDVIHLEPMHPIAVSWVRRLAQSGACLKCDSWKHDALHCPCVLAVRSLNPPTREGVPPGKDRRLRAPHMMSFGDAVAKLARYDIHLPNSTEMAGKVLDTAVTLINKELPYNELLNAYDAIRGFPSSVVEHHALWIHASYNLLPSQTALAVDRRGASTSSSGSVTTVAMKRARLHLEQNYRYRDCDRLEDAVEVFDAIYNRKVLPRDAQDAVTFFQNSPYGFLFCFFDHIEGIDAFPAEKCSRPAKIDRLRPFIHCLCRNCLTPFHKESNCPNEKQQWDLSRAQNVLKTYGLEGMRDVDSSRVEAAKAQVDDQVAKEDLDHSEGEEMKSLIDLAMFLIYDKKTPYCRECNLYGHSLGRCDTRIRKTLAAFQLSETEIRLNPQLLETAISRLDPAVSRERKVLEDARGAYCHPSRLYPARYRHAVETLQEAGISLNVCRYSPEAIEQFLSFTNRTHLLPAVEVCQELKFPDVCVYCSSLAHKSFECTKEKVESEWFFRELEKKGVSLLEFSVAILCPQRSSRLFSGDGPVHHIGRSGAALQPTKFAEERTRLVGFLRKRLVDAYSAGGAKRIAWTELHAAIASLQDARVPLAAVVYSPQAARQFARHIGRTDLYKKMNIVFDSRELVEVCLYCSSLAHRSCDCKEAKPDEAVFLRRMKSPLELRRFALFASDDPDGNPRDDGRDFFDPHETHLEDARASIIRFIRGRYVHDLEYGGDEVRRWKRDEAALQATQQSLREMSSQSLLSQSAELTDAARRDMGDPFAVTRATFGRTFSLPVMLPPSTSAHQLVPDPETGNVDIPPGAEEEDNHRYDDERSNKKRRREERDLSVADPVDSTVETLLEPTYMELPTVNADEIDISDLLGGAEFTNYEGEV